jgi:hypothetical protein
MKLLVAVIVVLDVLLDPVAPCGIDLAAREDRARGRVRRRHAVTTIYSPKRTRGEGCRGAMSGV